MLNIVLIVNYTFLVLLGYADFGIVIIFHANKCALNEKWLEVLRHQNSSMLVNKI